MTFFEAFNDELGKIAEGLKPGEEWKSLGSSGLPGLKMSVKPQQAGPRLRGAPKPLPKGEPTRFFSPAPK